MSYSIRIERKARKALDRLDARTRARIEAQILDLADDPRPFGSLKLTNSDAHRIRIGDYRVIYVIEDDVLTVAVITVAHRRESYRKA